MRVQIGLIVKFSWVSNTDYWKNLRSQGRGAQDSVHCLISTAYCPSMMYKLYMVCCLLSIVYSKKKIKNSQPKQSREAAL